ncbi:HlyD family efflux transporter periplasmic adaptor subunit [Pseudoalteromonas sp. Of7M-16]|uniref:efflux RND transporter periplasmic adaptor subunit n=1 Tax=Pseudoalteromonas sp. Of7M-16 TaxID=2917756 RepID=UPI001EF3D879|nr:HlyD family efflux transporter periplasmic adaptor subunit [Pseudoalteromonas sp. Of7M-16]MCG7548616.1 HlyD family efflux transporter periplasmic adaptor subunit [Pseudoalteromonas sp. Of7M-16]
MDVVVKKKTDYKKVFGKVLGVCILLGGAVVFYNEYNLGDYSSVKLERVTTSKVIQGSFENVAPVSGAAESLNTVYLDAIQGGIVDKLYVEKGDFVEAGQKIIEFKNTAFQLQVYSQEARVSEQLDINTNTRLSIDSKRLNLETERNEIEYDIKRLTRKLKNYQRLISQRHVSADDVEAVKEELEFKTNQLAIIRQEQESEDSVRGEKVQQLQESEQRLKAHLNIIRASLDDLVVKAPISGQVTSLDIKLGESKSQGEHLGKLDQIDRFKIVADVGSFYISKVKENVKGSIQYQGKPYQVVVDRVYPEIINGTFKVDLTFSDQQPTDITSGQNFIVKLELSEPVSSLMVHNGAYYQDTGGKWVFVLDPENHTAIKRHVKLGRKNDRYVEVISGLAIGEKIISSSYANFLDSETVILE